MQQNVATQREALQRDQNYMLQSTITAAPQPTGYIERAMDFFGRKKSELETANLRGETPSIGLKLLGGIGAGFAVPIIGTVGFAKNLLTNPIETIEGIPGGIKQTYEFVTSGGVSDILRNNPGYAIGYSAGFYATSKGIGKLGELGVKGFQQANIAFNPKVVSIESSGIKVVEGTTIPTSISKLTRFEGTKIDTIHSTFSPELKYGSELQAFPEMATGSRKAIGQFNFYQSVPSEGQPVFYGGYVGIGEGGSSSITKFSFFEPKIKGFLFRDTEVLETPMGIKSLSAKDIVKYQTTTPGTFIPAENLKGMSIEGQVTTSVGEVGRPLFKIAKNPAGELFGKSAYYNIKMEAPQFIASNKILKGAFDILTSKNKRIYFMESKLEPIGLGTKFEPTNIVSTKNLFESQNTRYVSLSKSFGSSLSYLPSSSLGISSFGVSSFGLSSFKPSISSSFETSFSSNISSPKISSPKISSGYSSSMKSGSMGSIISSASSSKFSMPKSSSSIGSMITIPKSFGYDLDISYPKMKGKAKKKRRKGRKSPFDISPSFSGIIQNLKITSPVKVNRKWGVTPFQTRGILTGKAKKGSYFKLTDL
jgi:hypothetical protein